MLQIPLPPNTEEALRERAKASGQDVSSYAAKLLQEALVALSVEELLAPFRKQVEESGMTDEQLNEFGEELRREVRQEAGRSDSALSSRSFFKEHSWTTDHTWPTGYFEPMTGTAAGEDF